MHGWTRGWVRVDGWMGGQMGGWIDGWMGVRADGWTGGWMGDERTGGCLIDEQMNGWRGECG